ncbi:hypothetical protein FQR65_LT18217 [Abscondita terminalis]|nr:hypothetical protein FQR65_LT18217 [Abscondita terminalis]
MRSFVLILILYCFNGVLCFNRDTSSGVFGKIKAGIEIAGKYLGFDPENSLAQMISSSLSRPVPSQLTAARKLNHGTPYDWIINNSHVSDILGTAKHSDLPSNIVEYIKDRGLDEETDCLQLLICKSTPLIWGMQKTVNSSIDDIPKGKAALFANLPSIQEFADYGDLCENKHPYCTIYY